MATITTVYEDFEDTTYAFSFSGSSWARSTTRKHGGSYSYKSPTTSASSNSYRQFSVTVPPANLGKIELWYNVSSEEDFDKFSILVDSVVVLEDSGDNNIWEYFSYDLSEGTHTIRLRYSKDSSVNVGSDCVWVDDITFSYWLADTPDNFTQNATDTVTPVDNGLTDTSLSMTRDTGEVSNLAVADVMLTAEVFNQGFGSEVFDTAEFDTIMKTVGADSLTLSDSATPQIMARNYTQGATDSVTATDGFTKAIKPKAVDTTTLSDSAKVNFGKDIDDSTTTSDTLKSDVDIVETDSTTLNDSFKSDVDTLDDDSATLDDSTTIVFGKDIDDTLTVADLVNSIMSYRRSLSDSTTLSDNVDTAQSMPRSLGNDSVTLSDSITSVMSLMELFRDYVNIESAAIPGAISTDTLLKTIQSLKAESMTLLDDITKNISAVLTDLVPLSDSVAKKASIALTETMTVADIVTKLMAVMTTDSFSLLDSISKQSSVDIDEILNLADSPDLSPLFLSSVQDTLSLVDLLSNRVALLKTDILTLADILTQKYGLDEDETLSTLDDIVKAIVRGEEDEAIDIAEGFAMRVIMPDAGDDSTTIGDSIALKPMLDQDEAVLSLADSIIKAIQPDVDEVLTLADNISKNGSALKTESISISDPVAFYMVKTIADAVSLTDNYIKQLGTPIFNALFDFGQFDASNFDYDRGDVVGVIDAINYKFILARTFDDLTSLTDAVVMEYNSNINDTATTTDLVKMDSDKDIDEIIPMTEGYHFDINKSPFTESVPLSEDVENAVDKAFSELVSLVESNHFDISPVIADTVAIVESLSKDVDTLTQDTLSLTETMLKDIEMFFSELAIVVTDNDVTKRAMVDIDEAVSLSESIMSPLMSRIYSDAVTLSDDLNSQASHLIVDVVTLADLLTNQAQLLKEEDVSLGDSISSKASILKTETLMALDSIAKLIQAIRPDTIFDSAVFGESPFDISGDIVTLADICTQELQLSSALTDIVNLLESIKKDIVTQPSEDNTATVSDTVGMKTGKGIPETVLLVDSTEFDVNKVLSEAVSVVEDTVKQIFKVFAENVTLSDVLLQQSLERSSDDVTTLVDLLTYILTRIMTVENAIVSLQDSIRMDIEVSKQEAVNILEALGIDTDKPLPPDLVGVLDEKYILAMLRQFDVLGVTDTLEDIRRFTMLNQVFIGGTSIPVVGLAIKDSVTDRVSVCNFTIPDPSPEVLELCRQRIEVNVMLTDGEGITDYFGGIIKSNPVQSESPITTRIDVEVHDYTSCAYDRKVTEVYLDSDGTLTDILVDMWEKYYDYEIDLSQITKTDKTIPKITFRYQTLFDATETLAQLLGFTWYVDWNGSQRTLKFFPGTDKITGVTFSRANCNVVAGTAKFGQDDRIINKIYIFGGNTLSNDYTHKITANGIDTIYPIPHIPYPPTDFKPTIREGVAITDSVEIVKLRNSAPILTVDVLPNVQSSVVLSDLPKPYVFLDGVRLEADFDYPYWIEGKDVLINIKGRYIRFRDDNKPAQGKIIELKYRYEYPVAVVVEDPESIRKYGVIEDTLSDSKFKDPASAREWGKQVLKQYSFPKGYGSLESLVPGLRAGDFVNVDMPHVKAQGLFEIVEIEKKVDRNVVRRVVTLNVSDNPEDRIAKRLKDFSKRLQELETKDLDENTIIQKVDNVVELMGIYDIITLTGKIDKNLADIVTLSDLITDFYTFTGYYDHPHIVENVQITLDNKGKYDTATFDTNRFGWEVTYIDS